MGYRRADSKDSNLAANAERALLHVFVDYHPLRLNSQIREREREPNRIVIRAFDVNSPSGDTPTRSRAKDVEHVDCARQKRRNVTSPPPPTHLLINSWPFPFVGHFSPPGGGFSRRRPTRTTGSNTIVSVGQYPRSKVSVHPSFSSNVTFDT